MKKLFYLAYSILLSVCYSIIVNSNSTEMCSTEREMFIMRNYVFHGICGFDGNKYDVCVSGVDLDDAWQKVAICYPEFSEVTFVRDYKEV